MIFWSILNSILNNKVCPHLFCFNQWLKTGLRHNYNNGLRACFSLIVYLYNYKMWNVTLTFLEKIRFKMILYKKLVVVNKLRRKWNNTCQKHVALKILQYALQDKVEIFQTYESFFTLINIFIMYTILNNAYNIKLTSMYTFHIRHISKCVWNLNICLPHLHH